MSHGLIHSSLQYQGTVVQAVCRRAEFFVLLGFHIVASLLFKFGLFDPGWYDLELTQSTMRISGSLLAFYCCFYNKNVWERYTRLYSKSMTMMESSFSLAALLSREIPCKRTLRKLILLLLANNFIVLRECHHHRSLEDHEHMADEREFQSAHLESAGLINNYERHVLDKHSQDLGIGDFPSYLILQWCLKIYRTATAKGKIREIENAYRRLHNAQQDVITILDLPMPFQYFHLMNVMMIMNLTVWAYVFALADSYLASFVFVLIQLVYQGIREMTIQLMDPYGGDDPDFPVQIWANALYMRICAVSEDVWDVRQYNPLPLLEPLKFPLHGETFNLLNIEDWEADMTVDLAQNHYYTAGAVPAENTDGYAQLPQTDTEWNGAPLLSGSLVHGRCFPRLKFLETFFKSSPMKWARNLKALQKKN